MSHLERLPPHLLELFDYRTLTCLGTTNRKWRHYFTLKHRYRRTAEILKYLRTLEADLRITIIFERLSYSDVWRLFTEIQNLHGFWNMRYVYVPYAGDPVHTSAHFYLSLPYDIHVVGNVHIVIDSLPILFGNCVFAASRYDIVQQVCQCINIIWHKSIYNENQPIVSWFASNVKMCKIDTYKMKMYVSHPYFLDHDYPSFPISPEVNTWYPTCAHPDYIYMIVHGLLS